MDELGSIVKQARERQGLSQRELALRARTSQAAISRIESGLEEPSFARFAQIMRALALQPDLVLRPLAEHDADPRQLAEHARKSPQERFEESINWARFLRRLERVSSER